MSSITKGIMLMLMSCESVFAFVGAVALHSANILSQFANMKGSLTPAFMIIRIQDITDITLHDFLSSIHPWISIYGYLWAIYGHWTH